MIIDILATGIPWAVLTTVLTIVAHLPWYWAMAASLAFLMLYDYLAEGGQRRSSPGPQPGGDEADEPELSPPDLVLVGDIARNSIMFAISAALIVLILVLDYYLEAGGAKLTLPNAAWPSELTRLFGALMDTVRFPSFVGAFVAFVNVLGAIMLMDQFFRLMQFRGSRLKRSTEKGARPRAGMFRRFFMPLIFLAIIGGVLYGWLFPRWTLPLAQYQLAYKLWPEDFGGQFNPVPIGGATAPAAGGPSTAQPAGGAQGVKEGATRDYYEVVKLHTTEGVKEFRARLLTWLPIALVAMHILVAFGLELYWNLLLASLAEASRRQTLAIRVARHRLASGMRAAWGWRPSASTGTGRGRSSPRPTAGP